MQQPEELYELDLAAPDVEGAPILVHLDGFMDAGAAGRLLTEHLLDTRDHETIATFDIDRLVDYRSRRPVMTFDEGRWSAYDQPELKVDVLTDASGRKFLLIDGPEPDHEWELFTTAVRSLADRLGAGTAVNYFGVPMGIPHTRPLGVIAHGTRPGLVTSKAKLPRKLEVPGSAASLLELRFGEAGRDAIGFAVQVPHYLSQAAYPTAALALLESLREATGLDLPDGSLKDAEETTNSLIARQVSESTEVAELVSGLEQQWDAANAHDGENLLADDEEMPTADELAAQFEQFLAEQQGGENPEN
ncbi:MAG: PAC2 family protein [Streptosporangiales bacterium]|nr:PAC2 family protein [Streptosporangiales bacterium]